MLLESKSKFNWNRPNTTATAGGRSTIADAEGFMRWSATNMYRTSYNDMSAKVSPNIQIYINQLAKC